MVERAAPRRRAVKPAAANGGGPKGQALQPDGGEQTIECDQRTRTQPLHLRFMPGFVFLLANPAAQALPNAGMAPMPMIAGPVIDADEAEPTR
jgi:hypothetical protein